MIGLNDVVRTSPVLPTDIIDEAVPEEIREAEKFLDTLRKFTEFIKGKLAIKQVEILILVFIISKGFVYGINHICTINFKLLVF